MITTLRLMLDYKCYPVWLYDEKGSIVENMLPDELQSDHKLDAAFDDLQARYDALFVDNDREFSYKGFPSKEDQSSFLADWHHVAEALKRKVAGRYRVIDDIGLTFE